MVLFAFYKGPLIIGSDNSASRKYISMADVNTNNEQVKALKGYK